MAKQMLEVEATGDEAAEEHLETSTAIGVLDERSPNESEVFGNPMIDSNIALKPRRKKRSVSLGESVTIDTGAVVDRHGGVSVRENGRMEDYGPVDKNKVLCQLLDNAEVVQKYALQHGTATELLEEALKLFRFSAVLAELYNAFRRTSGEIDGKNGVANSLGLSRYGVYARLEAVGVNVDLIKRPYVSVDKLLEGNPVLKQLIVVMKAKLKKFKGPDLDWPKIAVKKPR